MAKIGGAMIKRLLGLVILVSIAGCQTPPKSNITLNRLDKSKIDTAFANATYCAGDPKSTQNQCLPPYEDRKKVSKYFKYGRFCGEYHPGIGPKNDSEAIALSTEQREEIAIKYYSLLPMDQIDEICQRHDVCWLLNTHDREKNYQLQCNDAFEAELEFIEKAFEKQLKEKKIKSSKSDTSEFRCAALAQNLQLASLMAMQAQSSDKVAGAATSITRFILTPLRILTFGLVNVTNLAKIYPREEERCIIDGLAKVMTPPPQIDLAFLHSRIIGSTT
jgi:hypothetical protein